MKLIGKAIREIAVQSELIQMIGTRFYNDLAPQDAPYPFVCGYVAGVSPVDSKASPGKSGKACVDIFTYRMECFSHDPEEAALLASKCRKVFDWPRPKNYAGIQVNYLIFQGAESTAFRTDDADVYSWALIFEARVDFSTDNL